MKKLIFLFTLICIFLSANIQAQSIVIGTGQTYDVYTGVASDTFSNTTNVLSKVIYLKNKDFLNNWYKYDISVDIDSLGDASGATITLQGSYNNSTWTTITAVTWSQTTEDTTIRYNNLASDVIQTFTGSYFSDAYAVTADTTGAVNTFPDSLIYPVITYTDARVNTTTYNVVAWPYLRIYCVGSGAAGKSELEAIRSKFILPFNR